MAPAFTIYRFPAKSLHQIRIVYPVILIFFNFILYKTAIADDNVLYWLGKYPFQLHRQVVSKADKSHISFKFSETQQGYLATTDPSIPNSSFSPRQGAINFMMNRFNIDLSSSTTHGAVRAVNREQKLQTNQQFKACSIIEVLNQKTDDYYSYNRIFLIYHNDYLQSLFICTKSKKFAQFNYNCSTNGYWPLTGDLTMAFAARHLVSTKEFFPLLTEAVDFFKSSNAVAAAASSSGLFSEQKDVEKAARNTCAFFGESEQ